MQSHYQRLPSLPEQLSPAELDFYRELRRLIDTAGLTYRGLEAATSSRSGSGEPTFYSKSQWARWLNGQSPPPQKAIKILTERLAEEEIGASHLLEFWDRAFAPIMPAIPRLYVSAPSDLDLRPLLDGLKRRGAEPYVLSGVARLGTEILQSLRLAIQRADQVLVVLGDTPAPNSMFEAGLALGLGKSLLIIAPPGATVPTDLAGQVVARARPDDLNAINFVLDHVQQHAVRDARRAPGPSGRPLGGDLADRLLARVSESGHTVASSIGVLIEAIEASGSVAVVNTDGLGFDLGVWSDDLEAIGGNPLLVEVKRSLMPGAVEQLLHGLADHPSARLGLVVYLEPPREDQPPSRTELDQARFPVLVISLQQLLRRMASASFAEAIRDLRNQSAHGLRPS
jgi:hypothetical protein